MHRVGLVAVRQDGRQYQEYGGEVPRKRRNQPHRAGLYRRRRRRRSRPASVVAIAVVNRRGPPARARWGVREKASVDSCVLASLGRKVSMRCDAMRRDAVRCDARGVATRTDGSNKKFEFAKFVTQPFPAATDSRSATVSRRQYRYRAKECKEPVPGAKLRQVSSRRLVSRGQWIADVDRGQWTRFASTCMAFAAFFEPANFAHRHVRLHLPEPRADLEAWFPRP